VHRLPEKYGFSGWVWILAAVVVVGFLGLGSYLVQTQQRLKAVEIELESARQAAEAEIEKQIARLKEEIAWERQALQSQVESLTQAVNQRKVEAAEREKQIAKLRQGIASCEEFFNEWEVQGAPASISAIAALGREAAAAKDCIDKGEVATACKHWRGLLLEIEKMGPPISESRGDIKELMRQNQCASN
jgi:Skp family chaperone for outer membrane proteins